MRIHVLVAVVGHDRSLAPGDVIEVDDVVGAAWIADGTARSTEIAPDRIETIPSTADIVPSIVAESEQAAVTDESPSPEMDVDQPAPDEPVGGDEPRPDRLEDA